MAIFINKTGYYQKRRMWFMVGMLLLVVLVPTVCLLWFVSEAVRNERMAVRQKLTGFYQTQLENLPPILQNFWQKKVNRLSEINRDMNPSERFHKMIESGIADSVILYDRDGELLYPCEIELPPIAPRNYSYEWKHAEQLEFRHHNFSNAAVSYADIAEKSEDADLSGRALQGWIRCLAKSGKKKDAIDLIADLSNGQKYREARDKTGRLIFPDLQLFAIESMGNDSHTAYTKISTELFSRIIDYSPPVMPPSQRLFLMRALKRMKGGFEFPAFDAEQLASAYSRLQSVQPGIFGMSKISNDGLWCMASADQTVVALFKKDRIEKATQVFINSNVMHANARFLFVPKEKEREAKPLLRIDAGDHFPDWEIIVQVEDDDLFMAASDKQVTTYIWSAILIIVMILILAIAATRLFIRQMSLARLKNDLITTVSHELKTPLASIRVLVDTLLDRKYKDEKVVKEYAELISKENERLSRLVENFLTFARIEDKRQNYNLREITPKEIVQTVYDSIKHRLEAEGFSFELIVHDEMPNILGDYDAMVMALINLLDNACSYSDKIKTITLAAYPENGYICLSVSDKGIGLSSEEKKNILEPFYQVDQSLSRKGGGFGLGLSIVKSILQVHNGLMDIESEPGKGSTFVIKVPVT